MAVALLFIIVHVAVGRKALLHIYIKLTTTDFSFVLRHLGCTVTVIIQAIFAFTPHIDYSRFERHLFRNFLKRLLMDVKNQSLQWFHL